MNGWIAAAIVLCFIIIGIWFTSLRIEIQYKREKENDRLEIKFSLWKIVRYQTTVDAMQIQNLSNGIPFTKNTETHEGNDITESKKDRFTVRQILKLKRQFTELLHNIHDFQLIVKRILRLFRCEKLEWVTIMGLGEAPATGMFIGMVWGIKGVLLGLFSQYITLRTLPHVQVTPEFNRERFDIKFNCVLRIKIGSALLAGFPILMNYLLSRREDNVARIRHKV